MSLTIPVRCTCVLRKVYIRYIDFYRDLNISTACYEKKKSYLSLYNAVWCRNNIVVRPKKITHRMRIVYGLISPVSREPVTYRHRRRRISLVRDAAAVQSWSVRDLGRKKLLPLMLLVPIAAPRAPRRMRSLLVFVHIKILCIFKVVLTRATHT